MTPQSIVIFGGSGFLGSRISQAALRKGWRVTCVSRSGGPSGREEPWHNEVHWTKGDATLPTTYSSALETATHVVSTIGVLDYRGVRRESRPSKVLDKLALTIYDSAKTFLSPSHTSPSLDYYTKVNVDTNETIARQISLVTSKKLLSFLYVSAAGGFPGIPPQYLLTKRRAEKVIGKTLQERLDTRTIFLRPGFMFDDDGGGITKGIARAIGVSYALNSSLDGKLSLLGAAGVKPLAVERVASAVVEACDDERVVGPVEIHQIEALADVRWRAEMIV